MADNRTPKQKQNQILPNFAYTDEQIEAAAVAAINSHRSRAGLPTLATLDGVPNAGEWRDDARAALVAAQGAAPQAESNVQDSPVIENRGAEISTPVQPSSTVGVGKIADEMERHRHVMVAPGPHQCSCGFVMSEDPGFSGWAREHKLHVARAVVAAIGGESRAARE